MASAMLVSLTAFLIQFTYDVAVNIIGNVGAAKIAELLANRDLHSELILQQRISFQKSIAIIFQNYIATPLFDRNSKFIQRLINERKAWLSDTETATKLFPSSANVQVNDVSEVLINSDSQINGMLLERLKEIGGLDGLPNDLLAYIRDGLLIRIQFEFFNSILRVDGAPELLFWE